MGRRDGWNPLWDLFFVGVMNSYQKHKTATFPLLMKSRFELSVKRAKVECDPRVRTFHGVNFVSPNAGLKRADRTAPQK